MRLARQLAVLAATASLVLTAVPVAAAAPPGAAERTEVGTYNLFLGGDIGRLLAPGIDTPAEFLAAADALWREVVASDFPSRAEAIADLLAEEQPDVVGLQEVARWTSVPLAAGVPNPDFDFLAILLTELAERGTPYEVVVENDNFDSSVLATTSPVPGYIPLRPSGVAVQYVDRDVIIARADLPDDELQVLATAEGTFATNVTVPFLGGAILTVLRGWTSADLLLHGQPVRFVNTHLEAFSAAVREAQARELAALLAASPYPVVLVGDLNDDPRTGAVTILQEALGLADAWRGSAPRGYTAGQDDLDAAQPQFDRRIDYVLYEVDRRPRLHATRVEVIGEEVRDRSADGLWPSDHAGVLATLHLTPRGR